MNIEPGARSPQFVGPARVPEEYRAKLAAARTRLRAALDPQTDAEEAVVTWLGQWEDTTMDLIAGMVTRRTGELCRLLGTHLEEEAETRDVDGGFVVKVRCGRCGLIGFRSYDSEGVEQPLQDAIGPAWPDDPPAD